MDYEKKYKNLLEIARKLRDENCDGCKICLETLFPELAESEDERISREITEFILTHRIDEPNDIEDTNTWLAWLEKQGEQKPKWKQSDDIRFSQLYDFLVNKTPRLQVDCNEYAAWLNSLKQRML